MSNFGTPNETQQGSSRPSFPRRVLILAGIVGVIVLVGIMVINSNLGIRRDGEKLQNMLNAQYSNTQIELGNCLDKSRTAAGVATALSKSQRDILTAAVTGRYQDAKTGASTASQGAAQQKAFVSAVVEAYPDLTMVSQTFNRVLEVVTGCRDVYNGTQQKLQVMIASFEDWKDDKGIMNWWGKSRFPSHGLEARDPGYGGIAYGQAALDRMKSVIVVKDAGDAYRNGELKDQSGDLFNDNESTTAP
jgi:hypothetical protein